MSARPIIPPYYSKQDWPRRVSQADQDHESRITALEAGGAVGAIYGKARSISATGSVAADDYALFVDASGGAVTVNLPAVASNSGRVLNVKKVDSSGNAVTLDGNASETIDGATTLAISTQYQSYTVHCDGSAWWII